MSFAGQSGNTSLASFGESPSFESSDLFLTNTSSPLPIRLLTFDGQRIDAQRVELKWQTASEKDNVGFDVERSPNGGDFVKIGFVEGAGNSVQLREYRWLDAQATEAAYYRLKQIDLDGTFTYSPVRYVGAEATTTLSVFPNPISQGQHLTVRASEDWQKATTVQMEVVTTRGDVLVQVRGNITRLEEEVNRLMPSLSAGTYLLRFSAATTGVKVIKLIRQ